MTRESRDNTARDTETKEKETKIDARRAGRAGMIGGLTMTN